MSKGKATLYAAIALLIGCLFLPTQIYGCFWVFLVIAAIYGGIAYAKQRRDMKLMAETMQEHRAAPTPMMLPPMTTKGSNRLFVPPPLERGK